MYPSFWFDVQRLEVKQIRELIVWNSLRKALFILSNIETQSLRMVCGPMELNVGIDSIQGSKLSSSNLLKGTFALIHQVIINSRLFWESKTNGPSMDFFMVATNFFLTSLGIFEQYSAMWVWRLVVPSFLPAVIFDPQYLQTAFKTPSSSISSGS